MQTQDLPSPLTKKDDRKVARQRKQNRACKDDPELGRTRCKSKVGLHVHRTSPLIVSRDQYKRDVGKEKETPDKKSG